MFDWILSIIEGSGYWGVFFLMVLENIFPPIPSELIIPLVGFSAANGQFDFVLVIVVATVGAVVGALPWYILGRLWGMERTKKLSVKYGRIMTLTPSDVDEAQEWFDRYGKLAVFFGRLIPTVRTLISIPAGIAKMHFTTFIFFTALGSGLWTYALALLGYLLQSEYALVEKYLNPVSTLIVVVIVGGYLFRVVTYRPEKK